MIKFMDYFSWVNVNSSDFWIVGGGDEEAIFVHSEGKLEIDPNPPRLGTIELTPEQVMCRLEAHDLTPEELIRRVECLSS